MHGRESADEPAGVDGLGADLDFVACLNLSCAQCL